MLIFVPVNVRRFIAQSAGKMSTEADKFELGINEARDLVRDLAFGTHSSVSDPLELYKLATGQKKLVAVCESIKV